MRYLETTAEMKTPSGSITWQISEDTFDDSDIMIRSVSDHEGTWRFRRFKQLSERFGYNDGKKRNYLATYCVVGNLRTGKLHIAKTSTAPEQLYHVLTANDWILSDMRKWVGAAGATSLFIGSHCEYILFLGVCAEIYNRGVAVFRDNIASQTWGGYPYHVQRKLTTCIRADGQKLSLKWTIFAGDVRGRSLPAFHTGTNAARARDFSSYIREYPFRRSQLEGGLYTLVHNTETDEMQVAHLSSDQNTLVAICQDEARRYLDNGKYYITSHGMKNGARHSAAMAHLRQTQLMMAEVDSRSGFQPVAVVDETPTQSVVSSTQPTEINEMCEAKEPISFAGGAAADILNKAQDADSKCLTRAEMTGVLMDIFCYGGGSFFEENDPKLEIYGTDAATRVMTYCQEMYPELDDRVKWLLDVRDNPAAIREHLYHVGSMVFVILRTIAYPLDSARTRMPHEVEQLGIIHYTKDMKVKVMVSANDRRLYYFQHYTHPGLVAAFCTSEDIPSGRRRGTLLPYGFSGTLRELYTSMY